jgi:hypothetical protein
MKKLTFTLLVAIILLSELGSCKKDGLIPGKKDYEEILNWSYKLPYSSSYYINFKTVPAVDENDNMYFYLGKTDVNDILSLDSAGTLRWQTTVNDEITSRFGYKNNKIFFYSYDETIPCKYFNCMNAENGSMLWSIQIFSEGIGFALTDDGIILDNNFNYNHNDNICKYDYNGNLIGNTKINDIDYENFIAITNSGNSVYLMGEYGNTAMAHLWKFTDNGTSFTHNWNILFSSDEGFAESENNNICDLAVNNNGDLYTITNKHMYSISDVGKINWNNTDHEGDLSNGIKKNVTITDSSFIIASSGSMYKYNLAGIVSWDVENADIAYKRYNNAPLIGTNNVYYTVKDGVKAINPDGNYYWHSFLPGGNEYAAMLHNGNMVFLYKENVYCIKTESGGLNKNSPWPKIYYDYGNTCNQKL